MIITTFSIAMTRHPASHLGRWRVSFTWRTTGKQLSPPHTQTNLQSVTKPFKSLLHSIQTSSVFFYYVISPQMKFFSLWVVNRLLDIRSKTFLQPAVCVFHSKLCAFLPPNPSPNFPTLDSLQTFFAQPSTSWQYISITEIFFDSWIKLSMQHLLQRILFFFFCFSVLSGFAAVSMHYRWTET